MISRERIYFWGLMKRRNGHSEATDPTGKEAPTGDVHVVSGVLRLLWLRIGPRQ